ncbi:YhcH/YjgK/YiaL family protein [Parasediminibacterium sp. JCM 36343]|uniref:YhcH/YjgK/YiaL family protein n=1 Tax=Parasediminibacterium sp. JCM 36343 TaxID=3374279 RepID=UPI00397C8D4B
MIIDTIQNAPKYFAVHPLFAKAFEYITTTDLAATADGKYEIDGDNLKAIISNKPGVTAEESIAKFECHDKHIDIQVCINGTEAMAWKPREKCVSPKGEYNPDKDVSFYSDAPDMTFQVTNGQFVILFPEDVHAPGIGEGPIKKLVIKVKI